MKNLIKIIVFIGALTGFQQEALSQNVDTDPVSKKYVSQLSSMVGSWEGEGWMMAADQKRHEFSQTEIIQFKLDSTAILIEGKGMENGKVIHNAMAIITYSGEHDQYDFQSFLQNGRQGSFEAELIDGVFYWYPMENIRYIIKINEQGQWFEIGEIKQGDNWYQFFEMTLKKN